MQRSTFFLILFLITWITWGQKYFGEISWSRQETLWTNNCLFYNANELFCNTWAHKSQSLTKSGIRFSVRGILTFTFNTGLFTCVGDLQSPQALRPLLGPVCTPSLIRDLQSALSSIQELELFLLSLLIHVDSNHALLKIYILCLFQAEHWQYAYVVGSQQSCYQSTQFPVQG